MQGLCQVPADNVTGCDIKNYELKVFAKRTVQFSDEVKYDLLALFVFVKLF